MLKAFKEFAIKGNMIDLAVGIILGAAFNGVVSSLVKDMIMPPFGLFQNKNFNDLFISLNGQRYTSLAEAQARGAPTINYGMFINNVINFLIVAVVLFILVRAINRFRRQSPPPAIDTKDCPYCLTKINRQATRCPACTSVLDV